MKMHRDETHVIVGAGLAGASAAARLRDRGYDGRVVLVGDEPAAPYHRPPLSKDYLRGETDSDAIRVHEFAFYGERDIELRTGVRATQIDTDGRTLALDDGDHVPYDALLLATGAEPRRLPVPGADLEGVHTLRTLMDADALARHAARAGRAVVVGAGWIGSEVAASLRQLGLDVVIVAPDAVPLERVLGREIGRVFGDLHTDQGVDLCMETGIEEVRGDRKVTSVITTAGDEIACDLVVAGIGVVPRDDVARRSGITTDGGIVVDDRLRTSAPNVYAAGDVASAEHPLFGRIRVEHWDNAVHQGAAAADNMLGELSPYDHVPYFFSDQYDLGLEYTGHAGRSDRMVVRGDLVGREFVAFWLDGDRITAGLNVNVWDVAEPIRALVASGAPVDAARLADLDVPLADVASTATGSL